jgi:hypothetical protein
LPDVRAEFSADHGSHDEHHDEHEEPIMTTIQMLVANERQADLQRAADQWRLAAATKQNASDPRALRAVVALRLAGPDEADVVRRLAELDEAPMLRGEVLLAVVDGRAVAAASLADGRIVADPFARTGGAVELLRLHRAQLRRRASRARWRGRLLPRFA